MSEPSASGRWLIGWGLDIEDRSALLGDFPPNYDHLVADHVTLTDQAGPDAAPPPATVAEVVGEANDGAGVQALVLRIAGTTDRPGGGTYHITWSLAEGRRPVESNTVIAQRGWRPCGARPIALAPLRRPL